jgi:hypothetical protein
MTPYVRTVSAISAVLLFAACTTGSAGVKPNSAIAQAPVQNPACPNQTSSRIPRSPADCSAFGRTYSSDDIDRTGATTTGGALRLLDPSVTVHN